MFDDLSPEDCAKETAFEMQAEAAWLRRAEYDPEAQDEMHRDDLRASPPDTAVS